MLVLKRKKGEAIVVDGTVWVTVLEVTTNRVRLGIRAPETVPVHREELFRRITKRGIDAETTIGSADEAGCR